MFSHKMDRFATFHELLLLVVEMVPEDVSVVVQDVNIIGVLLQLLHDVKEDDVLVIESLVEDFKGLVPDIGVSNGKGIMFLYLKSVLGICWESQFLAKSIHSWLTGVVRPLIATRKVLCLLMCWYNSSLG